MQAVRREGKEIGKGDEEAQASSCKINKPCIWNVQCGEYSI